jgi:hypothetical protein
LESRLTEEDRLAIFARLIQLRQPEHFAVPRDRPRTVGDIERHVIETLEAQRRAFYDRARTPGAT